MTPTEYLFQKAKSAGVPAETLSRFLSYGYLPQPKNLEFHAIARQADGGEFDQIGYGGTRGQGKTHAILCQVAYDDCQRFAGLKGLYLRKIQGSATEQFNDLKSGILTHPDFSNYTPSTRTLKMKNGSMIKLGGYKDKNQIANYIGIEYDWIVIEDATTIPESTYDEIRGSLRTSRPDWNPRIYVAANPGGIGHVWYKRRFVDSRTRDQSTRYIHTKLGDNAFINDGYVKYLQSLKGRLGQLWREGSWDVDIDGALWTYDLIDETRVMRAPDLTRIVVGVDPSGSEKGDAQGIIVAAKGIDGHVYILADATLKGRVDARYKRVVKVFQDWKANKIIAEKNYGGDTIAYAIKQTEGGEVYPC